MHLSPKSTFTAQMTGAVIGAIFDHIMMKTIVTNQFEILTSIEGSNIWSGQNVQQYNTLAIVWSIAGDMFSIGARYQWVTIAYLTGFIVPVPFWLIYRYTKIEFFNDINLSIILWYMGKSGSISPLSLFQPLFLTGTRLALCRSELLNPQLLRHRFLRAILSAQIPALPICKIQLPGLRGPRQWNTGYCFYFEFCGVRGRWYGA